MPGIIGSLALNLGCVLYGPGVRKLWFAIGQKNDHFLAIIWMVSQFIVRRFHRFVGIGPRHSRWAIVLLQEGLGLLGLSQIGSGEQLEPVFSHCKSWFRPKIDNGYLVLRNGVYAQIVNEFDSPPLSQRQAYRPGNVIGIRLNVTNIAGLEHTVRLINEQDDVPSLGFCTPPYYGLPEQKDCCQNKCHSVEA